MLSQADNMCSFSLGNYSGNVFGIAETSRYLSIRKLALKNKPTVRTIQCSEKWNSSIFIHTLMNIYPRFIPGYSRLLVIYTCTKPREETAGKWPLLFTSVSASKLTSGGTLRSTDMETNKCFYLRAPIMSVGSNSGTGWLWQSNGPASLFPCVPDGNLSTLTYKLHFPKSRFHLDSSVDTRVRQKEIRACFESRANGFSFYSSSKWGPLCCH